MPADIKGKKVESIMTEHENKIRKMLTMLPEINAEFENVKPPTSSFPN
ncbi:hypothetical protein TcasGA2_TC009688 [Tribolium castaneum]|uniref:Uncharacterized protein n=1 Tax=Tribolium castaneum TaxID=7070 RepID=D6WU34_TRICA|nr:hypothetical protein TcasGA2_TC009688 [Tribolium castaneum]